MTITELQKRVAELKGWRVSIANGELCASKVEGKYVRFAYSAEEAFGNVLSLLDEVEQEEYRTRLSYNGEWYTLEIFKYEFCSVHTSEYYDGDGGTREIAILTAYIAYRESTKSGE